MMPNHEEKPYRAPHKFADTTRRVVGWGLMGLIFAVVFALVFGFVVKWIWNLLLPGLFGWSTISFWQAFGIVVLTRLLFGGFGPHRHDARHRERPRFSGNCTPWPHPDRHRQTFSERYRNWRDYHDFWHEEGRAAFDAYQARKRQRNGQGEDETLPESAPSDEK